MPWWNKCEVEPMPELELTFEQALMRLEEITAQMEHGNITLDASLRLFEEGTALIRRCSAELDEAELKIVRLMKGPDGNPVEMEFEDGK